MYTVLLAVGTDVDQSLRSAEVIANLPGADREVEVTALNVFEEFEVPDADGSIVSSDDVYENTEAPESLQKAVAYLEERNISVTPRRTHGEPAPEIVELAREIDADVIVMGGRRRSPVKKALFGSVVQAVLLDSDRPVTVSMDPE